MKKMFLLTTFILMSQNSFSQIEFKEMFETIISTNSIASAFTEVKNKYGEPNGEKTSDSREFITYDYKLQDSDRVLFVKDRKEEYTMIYLIFSNTDENANFIIKNLDAKYIYSKNNVWVDVTNKLLFSIKFDGQLSILHIKKMNI